MGTTPEPTARPHRSGRGTLTGAVFVALILVVGVAGHARPARGMQDQPDFGLEIRVEDDRAVIVLIEVETPIASVQGTLHFDAEQLGTARCTALVQLGACNDNDGRVDFATVAFPALAETSELFDVMFEARVDDLSLQLTGATTETDRPAILSTAEVIYLEAEPRSSRWLARSAWIILGVVAVAAAGFVGRRVLATARPGG